MPGQRPGECGRRIAGRDACPTQKGRHPPHRGVSAVPPAVAPLYFFAHIAPTRTAGRCDQNLSRSFFEPTALPFALGILPNEIALENPLIGGEKILRGGWVNCLSLPVSLFALLPQISG